MNMRSRKALSPVVASIILIAVTVAVSIAVAAWMGALTFNFMATEQGQVTNLEFSTALQNVTITFKNTGTSPITINEVWINNYKQVLPATVAWNGTSTTIGANSVGTCVVTIDTSIGPPIVAGSQYEVKLMSAKGNAFPRSGTAPL